MCTSIVSAARLTPKGVSRSSRHCEVSDMSSKAPNPITRSAAWRISLWASLAFAIGTMLVFAMLHRFVADDIQRRSDAWLSGRGGVLGVGAARTPKDRL